MKKLITLMGIAAALFITNAAKADVQNVQEVQEPIWSCALTFEAKGGGAIVVVGYYEMNGAGRISCVDVAGNEQYIPVHVKLGGLPIQPNVGIGYFHIAGVATGIGVATDPTALLGNYVTASAQAGLIVGAGGNIAIRGGRDAMTLNVGIDVLHGFGAQLGVSRLIISPVAQ